MPNKYQAYNTAAQTASKAQQIVMLYDGAIRFVQQAKDAIRNKRIEERYRLLTKASDIVAGLQSCLDFEAGGAIAPMLYSFYFSVSNRVMSIHRTKSIEACDQVIEDLKRLSNMWREVDAIETAGSVIMPPTETTLSA